MRQHGDLADRPRPTLTERFWAKVDKNGPIPSHAPELGNCWIWTGAIAGGRYGRFNVSHRRQRPAHVVAYLLEVGPIPDGLEPDHLCRTQACVRPAHIEPVTHVENLRRADVAYGIRTAQTHCKQGHEFTDENTLSRDGKWRACRTCKNDYNRERMRRYYAERKKGSPP